MAVYETIKVVADVLQNMFLKISYISQENTYASASFLKFCYEIYESFKKTFFLKKTSPAAATELFKFSYHGIL